MSAAAVSAPIASTMINAAQSATRLPAESLFDLGYLRLASGTTLPNAKIGLRGRFQRLSATCHRLRPLPAQ